MDKAEFIVIQDNRNYSIVWQIFNEDSEVAKKFGIEGDISLPHFVEGEDLERLKNKKKVEVSEYNLTVGLLLEYFTPPPLTATHKIKPYFRDVLEWLLKESIKEYGPESTEKYILAIAAKLSSEFSAVLGYKVLKTGLEIIPYNSNILKRMWEISLYLGEKDGHKN